ncbi:bifunctional hydroxymethylpyrimidine kinase/phosphomethylpyrimidine kinase [Nocardioides sp.]|uniref:bifunctional hydroxymethylpyrimidine kinase/phosphomethylpyrimidine kinase n=1 Tax=Nocardioides sp. TaxID=35761 RepID=UPI0027341E2F|nr:bifunctional hydroxymethylpyrimidine kinase/phosphomethylpyrimidine kinase [Nocardioides sp.]MDP3894714.1 bifunctional hydroxymethylpyrimidine kinase/phosphomethylpyrimidine kinase [Nocardioides sp.]
MTTPPVVLAIAGTDSGGAAGLAADLTTCAALGAHGACVVAAVTAQDTTGVLSIHAVPVEVVAAQLDAVLDDLPVAAVKTGMLGSAEAVRLVADRCRGLPLVVDPVLAATSGARLATDEVRAAYLEHLLPVATVATPNRGEALALLGLAADDSTPPSALARWLTGLGCAVVVTGGPDGAPTGPVDTCTDWLALPADVGASPAPGAGDAPMMLHHPAVDTHNDHGTGCTFSAALAVHLARGQPLEDAVRAAATYTTGQLALSAHWTLGRGRGPIAHTSTTDQQPPHR